MIKSDKSKILKFYFYEIIFYVYGTLIHKSVSVNYNDTNQWSNRVKYSYCSYSWLSITYLLYYSDPVEIVNLSLIFAYKTTIFCCTEALFFYCCRCKIRQIENFEFVEWPAKARFYNYNFFLCWHMSNFTPQPLNSM